MRWLWRSVGVFASASSGSATWSARYARLSSKNGRRSGGNGSTALPTIMRCALAPHAIVPRGPSDAINAMEMQARAAIVARVKCERNFSVRLSDGRWPQFADVAFLEACSFRLAATVTDLRSFRNISNPLGLIRGAQRALLAPVVVVEHETN